MAQRCNYSSSSLARVLRQQNDLVTRKQALACALTESALRQRTRPGGPWQVVLPGVYLAATGVPTPRQRVTAAYLFAGPGLAITGPAALDWHGIQAYSGSEVDVLIPTDCHRVGVGFARLHRTAIDLDVGYCDGMVRYAPPARAMTDTVRQLRDIADVRAVLAAGVQRGKVQVWQLTEELARGPVQGSRLLRIALAEVAEGVRSAVEGDLLGLVRWARLPTPMLNPRLFADGEFLACPDAWWPEAGVAAEADSREWHLSPADWEQTMARHARMSAHGIIVLHYPPSRIRTQRREVAAEIRAALAAGRRLPAIQTLPLTVTAQLGA
jgi:hypothetical protein